MEDSPRNARIARLVTALHTSSDGALDWIERALGALSCHCERWRDSRSDLINDRMLVDLGDVLRLHHVTSAEPFTKDRFEYAIERLGPIVGLPAKRAPRGNPGHDLTLGDERFSLKTQADVGIKVHKIHISKYMELGKGIWTDEPTHLIGLRAQFFAHTERYDRIIILRFLRDRPESFHYELVEIPKTLLLLAKNSKPEMMMDSKQMPRPGRCRVTDDEGPAFELYFDGGTERKLQIKHLHKDRCLVHAEWIFPKTS